MQKITLKQIQEIKVEPMALQCHKANGGGGLPCSSGVSKYSLTSTLGSFPSGNKLKKQIQIEKKVKVCPSTSKQFN